MSETQQTISKWANETFGEPKDDYSIASRANQEMQELHDKLYLDDASPAAVEEAADIVIILMRLFERRGVQFWDEVERKMKINRARKWRVFGNGHGQHIED